MGRGNRSDQSLIAIYVREMFLSRSDNDETKTFLVQVTDRVAVST